MAARFYSARGFETFADAYLRKARNCYLRWGADGKVRQLDRLYPHLAAPEGQHPTATLGSPVQHLDVASVVKASQALSSEIELPKLIERLMTIALENAGADRGLLILPSGDEYLIQAEAQATGDQIEVTMRQVPITGIACPESLVRYVIRTQESVILDDASKTNLFSGDDYLRDRQSKSILCLPLIKQRQLTGILLLENTLTSHAFTPARIAVLELLAAQAAISLENTRLYSDLQERETKVRRLVDSNIIGILIGNLDGHVQEANQAFLQIVGYDQADLAAGRLRRTELTPAEWHDRDAQAVAELTTIGTAQPYEKEYFRKDGSRVPVLVGGATFGERRDAVVAFVVDLTEPRSARRGGELAHANRVATMGQLTASIAHEVNQPLAALLTNAETAVRWLARQPPNLEKARPSIDRIIKDGKRAADIVSRIRDFSKKAPARKERLEINEAILEFIGTDPCRDVGEWRFGEDATGKGSAAHFGGQSPIATGDPELDHECHRSDERGQGRTARIADQHQRGRVGQRACRGERFRSGAASGEPRAHLRGFLYDQVQRLGDGVVDLPLDRRSAWRPALGGPERTARRGLLLHAAGREKTL